MNSLTDEKWIFFYEIIVYNVLVESTKTINENKTSWYAEH